MGTSNSKIPRPSDTCKVILEGYLLKRSIRKGKSGGWQKRYYRLYDIGVLDTFKRKTSSQVKRRIVLTGMDDCQVTWDPMITSEVDYNTNEPPIFFLKNASKKEMLNVHLKAESVPKRDEWIESIMKIIKSKKEKEKQKEDSKSQEEGKKKESE